ncbi:hypothetical protein K461DRAFT_273190 [Myriangium duriaei CBS 260.36]|uniref:Nascent polypeptide-associated complex subunit alpha-like UBA domain-containing protein n=1 Tax=Myriangium duriaei CBS 260.36 TaxID=1168546 RepID=A0A9P4J919_9PEZI|nr:hypothetical protein K461DRAFT_273190 [Myriangium duriaei CBS 260.36]
MAEPQPSTVREGDTTSSVPGGADSRAAAAALSSLDDQSATTGAGKRDLDTAALGDAVARLEVSSDEKAKSGAAAAGTSTKSADKNKAADEAKKIKIEAADVALVVEQCELSKPRATELLRTYDGNLGRALRGWVGVGVPS